MKELSFIPDNLAMMSREMGISTFTGFLETITDKVKKLSLSDVFHIDLFLHSTSVSKIEHWAITDDHSQYMFSVKHEDGDYVRVFGQVFAAVAIVVFDETLNNSQPLKNRIKQIADQYKLVAIANLFEESACIAFCNELKFSTKSVIADQEDFLKKNCEALLKVVVKETDILNKLKRVTYLNSISPLFDALNDIFKTELTSIKTRKTLNSQNAQISRKEEQGLNFNDLSANVRQLTQKVSQDLDKNFRGKYDDFNKPNTGKFSLIGQNKSMALKEFVKEDLAEKSERVSVTIDKAFQDIFLKSIVKSINEEMAKDESFIKSSFDDLLVKVNQSLRAKGVEEIKKEDIELPFPSPRKTIQSYCYIGRNFTGELTKHGMTEYFIALRDYIGVMMVATGLIAPLNIIASLSDEHSFIKPLSVGIKYATALITMALIIYGIFDLRQRIPRKRVEELEKELSKAREFLMQESKRMFNESSRDWAANIAAWIKDMIQNINTQFEKNVKDMQTDKMGKMNIDKSKQQRLQQSIDTMQNNVASAERIKDQLAGRFRDIVFDTEKDLKF